VGRFIRSAAPILRTIAKVAGPMVATAVGGPAAGLIARQVAAQLEGEGELEEELGVHHEFEGEGEYEIAHAMHPEAPVSHHEALAEMMAGVAAQAQTEAEAEAMIGAATVSVLSPRDRAAIRSVLPHLVRGVALLTRLLRRRRITRPAVRVVPTIVERTTSILRRRAAQGQPVTRATAARVMAAQTRRVLSSPMICGAAMVRNIRASRLARAPRATTF
jgi:hypothetical protein